MSDVTVQIPQEALALAGLDDQSESGRARRLVALELFREERVSMGRAAELAGLSIEEFMEFSAHRQVPIHYSDATPITAMTGQSFRIGIL
jgi:predicted HTH domain antitoxin